MSYDLIDLIEYMFFCRENCDFKKRGLLYSRSNMSQSIFLFITPPSKNVGNEEEELLGD